MRGIAVKVWIDADACPGPVRDIVIKAANRLGVATIFVANKLLVLPVSPHLALVQVQKSADAADQYIADNAGSNDLIVTQDIVLASILVPRGIVVIDPRGDKYSPDNIGDRLSMRNFMQELRDTGEVTGGPKQFGDKEKRAFAATFDRELTRLLKRQSQNQS